MLGTDFAMLGTGLANRPPVSFAVAEMCCRGELAPKRLQLLRAANGAVHDLAVLPERGSTRGGCCGGGWGGCGRWCGLAAAGFDAYWTKPIQFDRFLAGIDVQIAQGQGASRSRTQALPARR